MKRLCVIFLLICSVICCFSACSKNSSENVSWQEKYDLGMRYLSENNYEEAIIAFTEAIQIDPKRVDAYIYRGDAYLASTQTESINAAKNDYEKALDLDNTIVELYIKLSNLYLEENDVEKALALLEQGVSVTGDERLRQRIFDIEQSEYITEKETITIIGHIIDNGSEYADQFKEYCDIYQNNVDTFCYLIGPGVRFDEPVRIKTASTVVTIQEARFTPNDQISNDMIGPDGSLIGKTICMEGFFFKSDLEEFTGPEFDASSGYTYYKYNPNGEFVFHITGYKEAVQ